MAKKNIEDILGDDESANPMADVLEETDEFEIDGVEPPELLPKGKYIVQAASIEKTESSNGNPQFELKFHKGQLGKRSTTMWLSLVPAAKWKAVKILGGFGLKVSETKLNFKRSDVVGKWVIITVGHRTWQGETRPDVTAVAPCPEADWKQFADEPI